MARIKTGEIRVEGLKELNRALKDMPKAASKEIRAVNKSVAEKVALGARSRAMMLGGVAARVAPTLKPSAGVMSASVSLGSSAYPEAAGAEFGSYRYKQFEPWTGNGRDAGRFLYPEIRETSEERTEEYRDALDSALRKVGLL